ncbi:DUF1918 domain-containing protein [Actinomadura coerulea]|uniref:DUF1918 domain-containing protein n=1 Tax=Actinomadura coerulea TaxID=46159 RepID=UPI00342EC22F
MIVEVRGRGGAPPYVAEWDDGHASTFYPSSDAVIERHPAHPSPARGERGTFVPGPDAGGEVEWNRAREVERKGTEKWETTHRPSRNAA